MTQHTFLSARRVVNKPRLLKKEPVLIRHVVKTVDEFAFLFGHKLTEN